MNSPRILISGAGTAGLSLARRLGQLGIEYTLLEKRNTSQQSGTGIALPFNAMQALRKLGLGQAVLENAHQVHEIIYTKKNGKLLSRANLGQPPLNQDKFVAMHRAKLHEILLDGIKTRVHYATKIETIDPQASGVNVSCSNPTLNGHYDMVVSAEGIHSNLRKQCFPEQETTIDHNIPNWRCTVEYPNHGLQPTYMLARTELFMLYPLSPDSIYCYGHVYDDSGLYNNGEPLQQLRTIFGEFGGQVNNILQRLKEQAIACGRLQSVSKPYYANGRIVFVGDAGNACSPLLQQGAASAFEDIICLTDQLQQYDVDKAITEYQRLRSPRVDWVVKTSDGPIKIMKTMRNPLGAFARNMLIRSKGPLNVQGWKQLAMQ